jgi:hypothetical protein
METKAIIMKIKLVFATFYLVMHTFSQDTLSVMNNDWITVFRTNSHVQAFDVDAMGNYFIATGERIEKLNSKGQLLLSQSIKASGNIDAIFANGAFKVYLFHSEQQEISILDNTLSSQKSTIDLEDFNIKQASLICPSQQSDKVWVYEQVNATLHLLSANKKSDFTTSNLTQLLGVNQIFKMEEQDGELFLFTNSGAIVVLDIYGSFLRELNAKESISQATIIENGGICFLTESGYFNAITSSGEAVLVSKTKIVTDAIGLIKRGNDVYLSDGYSFFKYHP